jgi:glyoxylase-like metal-dependent hydrolase (beta-lactamase superfamily II)
VSEDRLYFRQLLSGQDFARADDVARGMVNFVYLIGDKVTKECVVVDPAYDVDALVALASADGMKVTGALASHWHPDHVGGDMFGHDVQGIARLLETEGMKVHAQRPEAEWITRTTGVSKQDLTLHDSGDVVRVGEIEVKLIHTPGHTPGSQCFLVENRLVAGDTLFLQGCGRTDLPGGDARQLYLSLTQRLAKVPDDAILFPGHQYAPQGSASMRETRRVNQVFRPKTEAEFLGLFG